MHCNQSKLWLIHHTKGKANNGELSSGDQLSGVDTGVGELVGKEQ